MESGFEVYSRYFWKAGLDQFLHWLEEIRAQQACIEFTSPAICFSKKETYRQELHGTFEYMVQFHARHDHILMFWASSTSSFHRCYTFAIEALYTISPSSRFQIICAASSIEHLLRQSCSFTCHPLPSPAAFPTLFLCPYVFRICADFLKVLWQRGGFMDVTWAGGLLTTAWRQIMLNSVE